MTDKQGRTPFHSRFREDQLDWLKERAAKLSSDRKEPVSKNDVLGMALDAYREDVDPGANWWRLVAILAIVAAIAGPLVTWSVTATAIQPHIAHKPVGEPAELADNPLLDAAVANFATDLQANLARNQEKRRLDPAGRVQEALERRMRGVEGSGHETEELAAR